MQAQLGNTSEAAAVWQRLLKANPTHGLACSALGEGCVQEGALDAAQRYFERGTEGRGEGRREGTSLKGKEEPFQLHLLRGDRCMRTNGQSGSPGIRAHAF